MNSENIQKYEYKYIDMAFELANKSLLKQKHGAVIVSHKKIISSGFNNDRSQYKLQKFISHNNKSCACHAEMDAIYRSLNLLLPNYLFHPKRRRQLFLCV